MLRAAPHRSLERRLEELAASLDVARALAADEALSRAKALGRDTVAVAQA